MFEVERMHEIYGKKYKSLTGIRAEQVFLGPIVRINPHEIHVKDSAWVETLYAGSTGVRNMTLWIVSLSNDTSRESETSILLLHT